jgi:hypothetical protein
LQPGNTPVLSVALLATYNTQVSVSSDTFEIQIIAVLSICFFFHRFRITYVLVQNVHSKKLDENKKKWFLFSLNTFNIIFDIDSRILASRHVDDAFPLFFSCKNTAITNFAHIFVYIHIPLLYLPFNNNNNINDDNGQQEQQQQQSVTITTTGNKNNNGEQENNNNTGNNNNSNNRYEQ